MLKNKQGKSNIFFFQLYTLGNSVILCHSLTSFNFTTLNLISVPLPIFCGHWVIFSRGLLSMNLSFILNEIICIKYLFKFVWKRVMPIDDRCIARFLKLNNLFLGFIASIFQLMSVEGVKIVVHNNWQFYKIENPNGM